MGDILVNIAKDVDFNKVVTKDIFKTVFVDVVNPDQLAEAEADAEAFGMGALAQTDTFAIVTEDTAFAYSESTAALDKIIVPPPPEPECFPCDWDGGFGGDGNSNIWYQGGSPPLSLTVSPEDVDDIDGLGDFEPLTSPPPDTPDAPIPNASFDVSDLNLINPVLVNPNVYEYELQDDVVISFGDINPSDPPRDIINICNSEPDCDGADTIPDNLTGELTVTVAAGALFLVEVIADDPANSIFEAEIEFEAFGDTDGSGAIEVDETALWSIGSTDIGYGDFLFTGDSNSVGENATANYTITSIITDSLQFEECCFDVV